jgi:Ca-activated chloride channel family protein
MEFTTPAVLWFLAAAAMGLAWSRRRRPGLRYSDITLVAGLPKGRAGFVSALDSTLPIVAVTTALLAAAGPRVPDRSTRLPAEGISIMLAVDVSGSMAEADYAWLPGEPAVSRLAAAKRVLARFISGGDGADGVSFPGRPGDSLGLVSFAAWPEAACPMTLNHSVLLNVLESQTPKVGPDAGTNIGDAIAEGLIRLEGGGSRRKVLVLITDGEHNVSLNRADPPLTPRQAAQLAADLRIPIYAIDCGGEPTGDAEATARRDAGKRTLRTIATMTAGHAFTANDGEELRIALAEIDRLERATSESHTYRRYRDLSVWFGLVSLGCVVSIVLTKTVIWRVIPA